MSVQRLRQQFQAALAGDGRLEVGELDRLLMEARSGGGIDAEERAFLQDVSDGFSDDVKQRLLRHLAAMEQGPAWVNIAGRTDVVGTNERYATVDVGVAGLNAQVGFFDNVIAVEGAALADGRMTLQIEGHDVVVQVLNAQTASQVLAGVRDGLPAGVSGVLLSGGVSPYDGACFVGNAAQEADQSAHLMLFKPEALGLRPGEPPLKVIVTGYGAFQGITENPSATMAQAISTRGVPGAVIEYRRLDVTTQAVDAFVAEIKRTPPDVVLSMGVSSRKCQVEERPENRLGANRDGNNALMVARPVVEGGAPELQTDLPVDAIEEALRGLGDDRQVGTSQSDPNYRPDRSAYLCNYLGYNLANEFGGVGSTTAGFMHITDDTPVDQMHLALSAIVARQLEWRRANNPS